MTTYTAITDTETGHKKPMTVSLTRRLRDNPIAISEGSAGAPRINPIAAMSHGGATGAVGTYALLCYPDTSSSTITAGSTYAGSALRYVGFDTPSAVSSPFTPQYVITGGTPAGTWRAMGTASGKHPITLFLRIS